MDRKPNPKLPNRHHLLIGRSGTGKSTLVKRAHAKTKRLIVWDPQTEWDLPEASSIADLVERIRAAGNGALRIRYAVGHDPERFDLFCRVVWGSASSSRMTDVLVEELPAVATANKSPIAWKLACRSGRTFGLRLWATTQRPVALDQNFYTTAAYKTLFPIDGDDDIATVARLAGVQAEQYRALEYREDVFSDYLEKQPGKPAIRRRLTFN